MPQSRRTILLLGGGAVAAAGAAAWALWPAPPAPPQTATPAPAAPPQAALPQPATLNLPPAGDPRLAERGTGRPDAPVVVQEFFSLTCGHCANFHNDVWPSVKRELVETGQVRIIWRDFPLDGVALLAAAVARAMPADRYEAFLSALFQTQGRWAFAQNRQAEEIARLAALAGMDRATFDAVAADQDFHRAILAQRLAAEQQFQIRATPSFTFNGQLHTGGLSFAEFERQVRNAPRT